MLLLQYGGIVEGPSPSPYSCPDTTPLSCLRMHLFLRESDRRKVSRKQESCCADKQLTCCCVEPFVNIYLLRTSLISMSWTKSPSCGSFVPAKAPPENWAAIFAAIAAVVAAASVANLSSDFTLEESSSIGPCWSHLCFEDICPCECWPSW